MSVNFNAGYAIIDRKNILGVDLLKKKIVLLTVHLDILCNENQLDALFILNLFCQSTSICFGHVHCP
jgi:dimeric dUTPase (all-alpha-NTP-PPase superfamily)